MTGQTKKHLQEALEQAKEDAAKQKQFADSREESLATVRAQNSELQEQKEAIIRNIIAKRGATVWLQVVAIVLIVIGAAVSVASWRDQKSLLLRLTQTAKIPGSLSYGDELNCSSGNARWRARADGCHAEDAPSIAGDNSASGHDNREQAKIEIKDSGVSGTIGASGTFKCMEGAKVVPCPGDVSIAHVGIGGNAGGVGGAREGGPLNIQIANTQPHTETTKAIPFRHGNIEIIPGPENVRADVFKDAHTLELSIRQPCWLRVSEITPAAKVLMEAQQFTGFKRFSFDEKTALEVRAGCPGTILYRVNGSEFFPTNASKTPDKSEVADILL